MRKTMTLLVAVPLLAVASLALAEMPAVGVVGTWNVTMVQSADASCPVGKEGAATAAIWIVSHDAEGGVGVEVQGETAFPKLNGGLADIELSLSGTSKLTFTRADYHSQGNRQRDTPYGYGNYLGDEVWLKLQVEGDKMTGTQRLLSRRSVQTKSGKTAWLPCFVDSTVTGSR